MRATALKLILASAATLALAVPAVLAPTASAHPGAHGASPRLTIEIPGHGSHTIAPELIPVPVSIELPPAEQLAPSRDDQLAAAAFSADHLHQPEARDAALQAMSDHRAAEVRAGLSVLHEGAPSPAGVAGDAPIVVLGNGLNEDGSVHPNLASRLEVARDLAVVRPQAQLLASGGQTEWGAVESRAMRDWLVEHGLPAERISTEERSWATVSNAWHTRSRLPDAESVIVVTSQNHIQRAVVDFQLAFGAVTTVAGVPAPNNPPVASDPAALQRSAYRDAVIWYLAPDDIIADGMPPFFGPGIPRFWED